jgi:hypothetical protein
VASYEFYNFPCGYDGGNDYTLTVSGKPCDASPPPNDLCVDAIEVSEGATPFDNYYAGADIDFATCALIGRDVWFSFTAPETRVKSVKLSPVNPTKCASSGVSIRCGSCPRNANGCSDISRHWRPNP